MSRRLYFLEGFPVHSLSKNSSIITVIWVVAVLCIVFTGSAFGDQSATVTVTCEVMEINELAINNGGVSLIVNTAEAGSELDAATGTETYGITTNGSGMKIMGQLESEVPAGTSFMIQVSAPKGGASSGETTLNATDAAILVTGISRVAEQGMDIAYKFSATVAAGIIPQTTNIVTFTLTE